MQNLNVQKFAEYIYIKKYKISKVYYRKRMKQVST